MTKKKQDAAEEVAAQSKPEVVLLEFTIKKNGLGLEYVTLENQKKGSIMMLAETKRKSQFPPTSKLLGEVNRLKIFFAKACALWHDGFDKFVSADCSLHGSIPKGSSDEMYEEYKKASDTLDAINIEKVSFNGGFKIDATVQTMENKYTKMRTPKIDEEDEIFYDMDIVMESVRNAVIEFISDVTYDIKAESHDIVMRALKNNEDALEKLNSMTERDIFLSAIEQLEMKGALVMMSPELEAEIREAKKEKELEEAAKKEVDVPQEIVSEGSVKQFADSQSDHIVDGRAVKNVDGDDSWESSLKAKDEQGEAVTVDEEFL